jgi:glucosylceramidase
MQVEVATGDAGPSALRIDEGTSYQTVDGFGACFNALGWQALLALTPEKREDALRSLFAPGEANFTLGRVGMGANDFALGWYSYDETPEDYGLKHFTIENDRETILPFVRAAMRYQPGLGVWGVPWSPPTWMKTNGAYKGGDMKDDSQTLASYALYFSKYVQAYRREGIRLYAVMPQNEPRYNDNVYPQAHWSGGLMNVFLRDYLVPRLKRDNIGIEVWLGTIVNENTADYVAPVLDDAKTRSGIAGVASQYGGQKAMEATHERYPEKKLMQSETECFNGDNLWEQGMTTFGRMIDDMNHFAGSYFYWNAVLNDEEKSTWGWRQNSLLTVDRTSGRVSRNPEFYAMKHFSANVLPGARRVKVSGWPLKVSAFVNPGGDEVIEFANDSDAASPMTLAVGGRAYRMAVPGRSMNTVTIRGGKGASR